MPVPWARPADPRGSAPVELEGVLEGQAARAPRAELQGLAQQAREAVVVLGGVGGVGLAERAQPLHLDALARVELPDELAAREAHALAVAQQRPLGPPGPVALEGQERLGRARRRQPPRPGQRGEVGRDRAELRAPRAPELLQGRARAAPARGPGRPLLGGDLAAGAEGAQDGEDGPARRLGAGARGGLGAQGVRGGRGRARLGGRGRRGVPVGTDAAVGVHDEHAAGRRGGGGDEQEDDEGAEQRGGRRSAHHADASLAPRAGRSLPCTARRAPVVVP